MTALMQYGDEVDVPATRYGNALESISRKSFTDYFTVKDAGLHEMKNKPSCICHGEGVLELKCPYDY